MGDLRGEVGEVRNRERLRKVGKERKKKVTKRRRMTEGKTKRKPEATKNEATDLSTVHVDQRDTDSEISQLSKHFFVFWVFTLAK